MGLGEVLEISKDIEGKKENINELLYTFLANVNSRNTMIAYKSDLSIFFKFVGTQPGVFDLKKIDLSYMTSFRSYLLDFKKLNGDGYSRASINRIIATLYSFFEHLINEGILKDNPAARVKRFKLEKKIKSAYLNDEQVEKMLKSVDTSKGSGPLHYAILVTFFTTGMRQGELRGLRIGNLDYQGDGVVLKYMAKGGREIVMPLNSKAESSIGAYFEKCSELNMSLRPDDYIFRPLGRKSNKSLSAMAIDYIFKKYAKKSGIKEKITPHSARVSVISKLKGLGVGIDDIADFVGHADIKTTNSYILCEKNKGEISELL